MKKDVQRRVRVPCAGARKVHWRVDVLVGPEVVAHAVGDALLLWI